MAREFELSCPPRAQLDLRRADDVVACLREVRPDLVIHAAGKVGGIAANAADPYGFLLENLQLGINVVAAAVAAEVPAVLNLSSSCVYPRAPGGPLREDMLLTGPLEPTNEGYALAKITVQRLCEYASAQGKVQCKTLIPCNLYGRHDHFSEAAAHLVAAAVHKVHRAHVTGATTVEIWGDGSARREFMFAGDLAECVLRGARAFARLPAVMNVGVGSDHAVLDYYRAAADVIGWRGEFTFDHTKPTGMARKLLDVSRQDAFGWQPRTELRAGLRATYAYYLEHGGR